MLFRIVVSKARTIVDTIGHTNEKAKRKTSRRVVECPHLAFYRDVHPRDEQRDQLLMANR